MIFLIVLYNMPPVMRKIRNKNLYKVYNPETKRVYAKGTTKEKAKVIFRIVTCYSRPKKPS